MRDRKILFLFSLLFILLSCSTAEKFTTYEHYQTLFFTDFGYGIKVYKEPFNQEVLYKVQKGDKIEVTEFRVYKNEDCYLKVIIPSGKIGYINFGKNNIYNIRKDEFKYLERIKLNSINLSVLSFNARLGVSSDYMYSLPCEQSEKEYFLEEVDKSTYQNAIAITNDFNWIKFTINGKTGWVQKDCVYVDRGGLAYWTPAVKIQYELIDKFNPYNEI